MADRWVKHKDLLWRIPTSHEVQIGKPDGGDYSAIEENGFLEFNGAAKGYEDSYVPAFNYRAGVPAPTIDTGFNGDAVTTAINMVHTQADEVQFDYQLPHSMDGVKIYPHVHFTPYVALGAGTYAAQFILSYYWAAIDGAFSAVQTYTVTKTWTNEKQWYHLIAGNVNGIDVSSFGISAILKCRLYRDNTVANNFAGKLTYLGADYHYRPNTFGSRQEFSKT